MADDQYPPPGASQTSWQPITFGGAAGLAKGPASRVFLVGMVVAAVMAACFTRTFYVAWMPVVEGAIKSLQAAVEVRDGILHWSANGLTRLAESPFLAMAVSTIDSPAVTESDISIEFTERGWRATSLFGSIYVPYPRWLRISLDPVSLAAGWFAWKPHIVASVFVFGLSVVWVIWLLVGLVLLPFIRLYTALLQRAVRWWDCLRLGVVCCMPAEIVMAVGVFLYGTRRINLTELIAVFGLHVLGVVAYLLVVPFWLPGRVGDAEHRFNKTNSFCRKNPFAPAGSNNSAQDT